MDVKQASSSFIVVSILTTMSFAIQAEAPLLAPEQAFPFKVESVAKGVAQLSWQVPEQYYLYQHGFTVEHSAQPIRLNLPEAKPIYDENFGHTKIYDQALAFDLPVQASSRYRVTWQGCAKDRLCYPPQHIEFETDVDALVSLKNNTQIAPSLLDLAQQPTQPIEEINTADSSQIASDQRWFETLAEHSFLYGVLLFFGLGMLLAFTPCSLPMLPILTSLIVRDRKGLAAWTIALAFVSSMALVYAILGLVASSAGLGFQRWLQQPSTLMAFSALFVLFALNLFGLFSLHLPHSLLSRLDRMQAMQKGGSLASASLMGMLSALLVGPCMTAPLAGALLFISQTQQQWQGAILLFVLGFGMGTPLLLASVLGARVLPKAGQWMNQVKVLFGFIMLAVALYFIRPLLSDIWVQSFSLLLGLSFVSYVGYRIFSVSSRLKWIYIIALIIAVPSILYSQYQHSLRFFAVPTAQTQQNWQVAKTANEFQQILARAAPDRAIVIDVYADWCVACQPIEHRILKAETVQHALSPFTLIKLDLSEYDASHQALLNEWQILGPPTYLFLDPNRQELRGLRLTGAFTEAELIGQLEQLKKIN